MHVCQLQALCDLVLRSLSFFFGNCEEDLPKKPVGRLSVNCRPSVGRLSAVCRPTVGRLLADSQPTDGQQILPEI